jgi:DNA-nicking Smr family endonuclease
VPRKEAKRQSQADYSFNVNADKIAHSKNLTLVFEEASERFCKRRQRPNDLALEKCLPKQKSTNPRIKEASPAQSVCGSSVDDVLGGKAVRTLYHVVVGPEEYLYKSSKSSLRQHVFSRSCSIDLHGCTRDKAMTMPGSRSHFLSGWTQQ